MEGSIVWACVASVVLTLTAKFLYDTWKLCAYELMLVSRMDDLEEEETLLHEDLRELDAIISRHESRFRRIDAALRAEPEVDAPEQQPIAPPITRQGPGAALDGVLGKGTSRSRIPKEAASPQTNNPPDIWVDRSRRDKHGRAKWQLYYEVIEIPVVLTITIGYVQKVKRSDPRRANVFLDLHFASFEELCDSNSSSAGTGHVPVWKTVLTIDAEEREEEYRSTSEGKAWAMSVLRREIDPHEGTDLPSEYRRALRGRTYRRVEIWRNERTMDLLKELQDPDALRHAMPFLIRPPKRASKVGRWIRELMR
jgi:hypothetical protein